jgi:hypothetical protein
MKKNVIIFGLISGTIVTAFMLYAMVKCHETQDLDSSMLIGYATMIVAFSFVFIGIKNQRDKYNGGFISFGSAFKTGFYIALIASTMYVAGWGIEYHYYLPDFMDKYSAMVVNKAKESGATEAEISKTMEEVAKGKEMYKNPLLFILITYAEILPVGLVIALISALILKRKPKGAGDAVAA